MVSEIRIYIEGGGDGKDTKGKYREGMSYFLRDLKELAKSNNIRFQVVACGRRNAAYRDFKSSLKSHRNALNILLVDSENFVTISSPKQHLSNRDNWQLSGINEAQIHLMVQMMESWIIADVDALTQFYGQHFNQNAIPRHANVEQVAKDDVESALKNATRRTQKGQYHKIHHGPEILKQLNISTVRSKAPHCDRLFTILTQQICPNSN